MGVSYNKINCLVSFLIVLFVAVELDGQTKIYVQLDSTEYSNSFILDWKNSKGKFPLYSQSACFGMVDWNFVTNEKQNQLNISAFGYYDTTVTIPEKESLVEINLQERTTFNELRDNEIYQSSLPFMIWIKDDTHHLKLLNENSSTTWVPYPYFCISEEVEQFDDFCRKQHFQYDTIQYNYMLYFCKSKLTQKPFTNRSYNPYTQDLMYIPIKQLILVPYVLETLGVKGAFYYVLKIDDMYFRITPSITLSPKKEMTKTEVKNGLRSIKKGYRVVKSYRFNHKFKSWNNGGYGYFSSRNVKYNRALHFRNLSFPRQQYMKQYRMVKNCIKMGKSEFTFDVLYPQSLIYWNDLFIESGIFTSVYIEKEPLTAEMFR